MLDAANAEGTGNTSSRTSTNCYQATMSHPKKPFTVTIKHMKVIIKW
jgi:hypothetical protein